MPHQGGRACVFFIRQKRLVSHADLPLPNFHRAQRPRYGSGAEASIYKPEVDPDSPFSPTRGSGFLKFPCELFLLLSVSLATLETLMVIGRKVQEVAKGRVDHDGVTADVRAQ